MTWTGLSSMVLLLGAELNSEIEHQTARDTTTGAAKPLGSRGAVMADTIGEAQTKKPSAWRTIARARPKAKNGRACVRLTP